MPRPYKPHVTSNAAESLGRRALAIDWFSSVGALEGRSHGIDWVNNWEDALSLLVAQEWDDYLLDAGNNLFDLVPRPQRDDWNWAMDEAKKVIDPPVREIVRIRLAASGKLADKAAHVIMTMLYSASVEAHFHQWVSDPFFGELFKWLEAGRLPCGAAGEYPAGPLRIF